MSVKNGMSLKAEFLVDDATWHQDTLTICCQRFRLPMISASQITQRLHFVQQI